MANRYRQICWLCKKATNGNLCSWPKDLTKPKDCVIDNKGYIVKCPYFELDLDSLCYTDLCKIFNITKQSKDYLKFKNRFVYLRYKNRLSPKEIYLLLKEEEKKNVNTNCCR